MKIAQVAPLHESVPPKYYGGTERIVSYLTEELIRQGHEVTLFASGDSVTKAELQPIIPCALRLHKRHLDPLVYNILQMNKVASAASEFDIIHYHIDFLHFNISRLINIPQLTTLHGRLDLPALIPIFKEFTDMPVVSISNDQRKPLPFANWLATIYNGVPEENYTLHAEPGEYLAFLGRISPEKRVDRAIEIAIRVDMPLCIAAKVDRADQGYFEEEIKPLLKHPLVNYIGEISENEKDAFLGNAYALLFPIDWPEPFGLVMIEAMACGTPVIAYRHGSVPEVISDGKVGFVVDGFEEAVAAVEKVETIDRHYCRQVFENFFSARRMTKDYLVIYQTVNGSVFQPRAVS